MDPQQARRYVRHLRYLYQDLILFGCVSLVCYVFTFPWGNKIALIMVSWGISLWTREAQFNTIDRLKDSFQLFSKKWEDYKTSPSPHAASSKEKI
jgi:hypothetical protein